MKQKRILMSIAGVLLNAILPGKDYEFGTNEQGDIAVDFEINRVRDK